MLEAGRHIDLEIDRLLLDVFVDDMLGLPSPPNERFLDALALSFNRASRSHPGFFFRLGKLSVSPKVLAVFLLVLRS
jgi:hypothetical protein